MDGRQPHARRHPSFDAGDDQFFTYPSGAPADYGGYPHRRGQHSSASGYDRPPRTPDHGDYDYSQYAAARLAISPPFGAEYDNGVRYDNVHHSQQPSLSQSVVSYSSNVPSPPPHRDLPPPPVPPPHRSQHSFRQHQSQFPISDTISERPLEEGASLQHSSSQSSTQYPQSRALPPTPDDAEEEDDCEFDSVLENIAWVPSPPARNGVGRGVEDPEAVLYRDDRGMSIGSIDAIFRHGSSGRESLARHSSTNSPGYDRRSVGSMMRAENEPAAPFTISGYAPDDDVDQTPVDYSGLDDSFLDAYDDMSILSPPPLGHRGSQGNSTINPNAPSTRLDYDDSYATAQESPSDPQSPTASGFMDSFDDLDSFVRPLPIPPGRSLSATTRPTPPRPDSAIPRSKTHVPTRNRHTLMESSASGLKLDLPTIPMGRSGQLEPSRLTKLEFNRCTEPWAASSLVAWLKDLAASVTEISKDDVTKCLLLLIQNKTPTIALLDAEKIAGQVVNDMLAQGVLEGTEPELKFTEATLSGVFWQLTGHGCYSLNVHGSKAKLLGNTRCACYSRTCMRQKQHRLLYGDLGKLWQDFWGIKHQNISHEENEYQNAIRELVKVTHTNWKWLDFLNTTVNEYLRKKDPALILAMKSEVAQKFVQDVFGHFPDTAKAVKEYFLLPLRAREVEQGPYVRNISDIVIEFTKRARPAFTNDIGARNRANFLFARQRDLNETFKLFATVTLYKLPERIGWGEIVAISVKFPSSIIATLEKMKKYCSDPVEKENIDVALKELNAMLHHLNTKQDEAERTGQPRALASILTISSKIAPFKKDDLLLNERGRQVIYDKELSRPTSSAVRFGQMSRIRGILLDNYMLFAKTKYFRTDEPTSQVYEYVVDRPPIPIRMLALEWPNDDGGSKNVLGLNARNQVHHIPAGGMMTVGSAPPVTVISEDPERTLFPFTIKHLGGESHEVYASSRTLREHWCDHIKQALQSHVKSARPSEPFRLRVLADNSFVYSQDQSSAPRRLYVKGTALYDAIREVEAKYPDSHSRGSPVARGDCLCSTVFNDVDNVVRCYIGTTTGLYISDYDNPRGWQKVSEVNGPVEQVAVMEDFRLVITLGSGNLFAWEMGTIDNPSSSSLQSPEVLSGGNPFLFTIGRLDDRIWVAYAKEAKMGSTVLKYTEPVLSQSASLRRRIFNHRNPTQHFRKFDGDVPYANGNLIDAVFFTKTVALVMNNEIRLGKGKDTVRMQAVPVGIDDPRISPESSHIFSLIRQSEARAIFKLDSRSFILVYTKCAVIVNANAQITRHQPHFFAGVFNSVRLYKGYLILIYDDFIEILNAQDGRQRQIISGRNIRLLTDRGYYDQTSTNPDPNKVREATVKVAMQHPEEPRNQLVVELVLA